MTEPRVFAKKAMIKELDAGTHYWCACGRSANQPMCDGSHQGTDIVPVEFTIETKKKVSLCLCKHTESPPYCDASHTKL